MLDPNYLLRVSEGAEQIAEELHSDIVNRIVERMMIRIGRGDDYLLTALDKWQIETVQQAGVLLEDIQKEIAKATRRQQSEIAEAMEEAGVKALEYDHKLYQDVGLSPEPLTQSPHLIRLMQRNYEATMGEWRNFTRTTAFETQKIFITQMDRAYHLVSTGALSYTEAVKEVLDTIVSEGVYVLYPSGHKDTIETATLRAVRTGISQATGQIQEARMDEMDVDLVITSSHLGARPDHQEWQGKIFSRSGSHEKYPNFKASTGYGTGAGLCGWNCRHSFGPYFEGMDNPYKQFDSKENQEQYEKEQHQRALERHIRDTKREVMGIKTAIDNCQDGDLKEKLKSMYQQKAALLEKQNDAYHTYCGNNDLKPLEDRLQIAKWDRKQAAAARGAAKKHRTEMQDAKKTKEQSAPGDYSEYRVVSCDGKRVTLGNIINLERKVATLPEKARESLEDITFYINSDMGGGYWHRRKRIYLPPNVREREFYHEVGHRLEVTLFRQEDVDRLKHKLVQGLGKDDILVKEAVDSSGNKNEIFVLSGPGFIRDYQGRLYVGAIDEALNEDGSINIDALGEIISVAVESYFMTPKAMKKNFAEMYRLVEEALYG